VSSPRPKRYSDEYKKVIPYAGLIFEISQSFSTFASYSKIFKPPAVLALAGDAS
jgi:outer membrane receptor for ferric coprogen and ferric-rhodotorulic acid